MHTDLEQINVSVHVNLWVILDRKWWDQSSQVHWQQASAMPTTDCHNVQHAIARDTDLQVDHNERLELGLFTK